MSLSHLCQKHKNILTHLWHPCKACCCQQGSRTEFDSLPKEINCIAIFRIQGFTGANKILSERDNQSSEIPHGQIWSSIYLCNLILYLGISCHPSIYTYHRSIYIYSRFLHHLSSELNISVCTKSVNPKTYGYNKKSEKKHHFSPEQSVLSPSHIPHLQIDPCHQNTKVFSARKDTHIQIFKCLCGALPIFFEEEVCDTRAAYAINVVAEADAAAILGGFRAIAQDHIRVLVAQRNLSHIPTNQFPEAHGLQ